MELKEREQIIKALECFHHRILNTKLAEKVTEGEMMAVLDALSLIKELTVEYDSMAKSVIEADELIRKLRAEKKELTKENERLRANAKSATEILNFQFVYGAAKADTVRKMQTAIKEYYSKSVYRPTQKDPVKHTQIEHLFYVIDQIAKEMLEGKNERT